MIWIFLQTLNNGHFNPGSAEPGANSADPDQLASKKPNDLDLHCLLFSMLNYINNLDQVI